MLSAAVSRSQRAARWASENPVAAGAVVLGAGAVFWMVYKVLYPPPLFKADAGAVGSGSARGVRFEAETECEVASPLAGLVRAIRELHAEGVFKENEARAITREFVDLAKASGGPVDAEGNYVLTREACRGLFETIGVRDPRVSESIFDSFDEDGSGTISLKEFLHALVLTMHGSATEKLDRMFDCIDLDHDGRISEREMREFYRMLYAFSGKPRAVGAVSAQVAAMFKSVHCTTLGYLTREEFRYVASEAKFHVGDTLVEFYDEMMKRLALGMESAAAGGSGSGAPGPAGAASASASS